jgi:hypothetical protein
MQYRDWRIRIGELGQHSKVTAEDKKTSQWSEVIVYVLRPIARRS